MAVHFGEGAQGQMKAGLRPRGGKQGMGSPCQRASGQGRQGDGPCWPSRPSRAQSRRPSPVSWGHDESRQPDRTAPHFPGGQGQSEEGQRSQAVKPSAFAGTTRASPTAPRWRPTWWAATGPTPWRRASSLGSTGGSSKTAPWTGNTGRTPQTKFSSRSSQCPSC